MFVSEFKWVVFVDFLLLSGLNEHLKSFKLSLSFCLQHPLLAWFAHLPSLSSFSFLSTPSLHPSIVPEDIYLGGWSDEVYSLRKVCLLDWLIRCLVRVFGGKSGYCLSIKWGGSRMRSLAPQSSNERSGSRGGALRLIFHVWFLFVLVLFIYLFSLSLSASTVAWHLYFMPQRCVVKQATHARSKSK